MITFLGWFDHNIIQNIKELSNQRSLSTYYILWMTRWKSGSKQEHLVPTFPPDVVKWCTQNGVKIPLMGFYLKLISHKKWSKSTIHLPWKFFSIAARSNTFLFVIIHSNYSVQKKLLDMLYQNSKYLRPLK